MLQPRVFIVQYAIEVPKYFLSSHLSYEIIGVTFTYSDAIELIKQFEDNKSKQYVSIRVLKAISGQTVTEVVFYKETIKKE